MRFFCTNVSLVLVLCVELLSCVGLKKTHTKDLINISSDLTIRNELSEELVPISGELSKLESQDYDRNFFKEGLEARKGNKQEDFMQKILPFMVIPFMISSMMIPMALIGLKLMLLKSALVGKIGIILLLVNMFTRFNNRGGVYSHNINLSLPEKDVAMAHYGYSGDEEYGAYVHHRRRRRKRRHI